MPFYGEFLVQLGVVRQDQLGAALAEQSEGRLLLGELAVVRGVLTEAQVQQVRRCQRQSVAEHGDLRFGEMAVALGFSTVEAMDQLHREQRAGWRRVGDILVESGALDHGAHESYLRDFLHLEMSRRRRLETSIAEAPHSRVVEAMVDLARRWLPRFGLVDAKVVDVRIAPRAIPGIAWSGRRDMTGLVEVITVLGVSTGGLRSLAGQTLRPEKSERPDLSLPALAEAIETLTELGRNRLEELKLEPAPARTFADDGFESIADLVAERDLVQVELVHGTSDGGSASAVLTLVTREIEA